MLDWRHIQRRDGSWIPQHVHYIRNNYSHLGACSYFSLGFECSTCLGGEAKRRICVCLGCLRPNPCKKRGNLSMAGDNQNCLFYEFVKMWNGLHRCVSLIEMFKKNIYGMSNSESEWRSYAPSKMLRCQDFRPKSGLPTVGSFDRCQDFREAWRNLLGCLGLSPHREFQQRSKFWQSEVSTQVRTSDRPNKKPCSGLAF
jgi:hypothetical protein